MRLVELFDKINDNIFNESIIDAGFFNIYENPSRQQFLSLLKRFKELRGMYLEEFDSIFIWEAEKSDHGTAADIVGSEKTNREDFDFFVSILDEAGSPSWGKDLKDYGQGFKWSAYASSIGQKYQGKFQGVKRGESLAMHNEKFKYLIGGGW